MLGCKGGGVGKGGAVEAFLGAAAQRFRDYMERLARTLGPPIGARRREVT